ncbi:hypothetical protein [Alcaligenes sp. Marseille-Q7550]
MKAICERHREAQAHRGRQCVACEIEDLQLQITRAQLPATAMWNWMNNPVNAKDLTGDELRLRFLREFRQTQ